MISRVREYIVRHGMIEPGDRVIAGVSGGADSVCLLLVLRGLKEELSFSLSAVHVEHGLRGRESLDDAAFVEELCEREGIPCRVFHVDVKGEAARRGHSLEEAGRELRYACFGEACRELDEKSHSRCSDEEACFGEACRKADGMSYSRGSDGKVCFGEACRKAGTYKIAVAHHRDDQAETVLMNLFRGTGLRGLCGMAPVRGNVIRPLLELERREIEEWLTGQGIMWRTDRTNLETEYTRNKLRLQVLPFVEREVWPRAGAHAARAAEHLRQVQEYLDGQAWKCYESCVAEELAEEPERGEALEPEKGKEPLEERKAGKEPELRRKLEPEKGNAQQVRQVRICLESFRQQEPLMRTMVLQLALKRLGGGLRDVGAVHLEALLDLAEKESGKEIALPRGILARREYDSLILERRGLPEEGKGEDQEALPALLITEIPGTYSAGGFWWRFSLEDGKKYQKIPEKAYTKWFDYDKIKECLSIRPRCPGDFLEINREHGQKKLKDYLIDSKVPRRERDRMLFLADGSHILWIPGRRISEGHKVTGQTKRLLRVEIFGGNTDDREDQGDDPRGGGRCQD